MVSSVPYQTKAALGPPTPPPFYLRSLTLDFRRTTLPTSPHLCFQMIGMPLPRIRRPLQVFPIVRLICCATFNAPQRPDVYFFIIDYLNCVQLVVPGKHGVIRITVNKGGKEGQNTILSQSNLCPVV